MAREQTGGVPTFAEMRDALEGMWTEEFGELELTVHHTLTEPTCPTAVVKTEQHGGPWFRYDADTIEEAIYGAMYAAYVTLVLRQPKPRTVPWSERKEDEKVTRFLAALALTAGET